MSILHELCSFGVRPIVEEGYLNPLRQYLKEGIPATYTVEERIIYEFEEKGHLGPKPGLEKLSESSLQRLLCNFTSEHVGFSSAEEQLEYNASRNWLASAGDVVTTTTPLHLLCYRVPKDATEEELEVVGQMAEELFLNGTGWNLVDSQGNTPGCVLNKRQMTGLRLYEQILDAGVRAEMVFRKIEESNIEFVEDGDSEAEIGNNEVEDGDSEAQNEESGNETQKNGKVGLKNVVTENSEDPADNQNAYLQTKLEYRDNALVTSKNKDGVMMSWETKLMKLGCDTLFERITDEELEGANEDDEEINLLNIGFGMGIIDSFIQQRIKEMEQKHPRAKFHHYICEAHPDVISKLQSDGWFEKRNVTVLQGKWQEELDKILSKGTVFFNGVYYDTFSEHYYPDMFPNLIDLLVGLIKPHGIISFFNGLGADRQVVYDVYCKIVKLDLGDYGFAVDYQAVSIDADSENRALGGGDVNADKFGNDVWSDVKRSYWNCPVYYHPRIRFA